MVFNNAGNQTSSIDFHKTVNFSVRTVYLLELTSQTSTFIFICSDALCSKEYRPSNYLAKIYFLHSKKGLFTTYTQRHTHRTYNYLHDSFGLSYKNAENNHEYNKFSAHLKGISNHRSNIIKQIIYYDRPLIVFQC